MTDDEPSEEYDRSAAAGIPVERAAPGAPDCGKQCPCGSDCIRPAGHDGLGLCIGDEDRVPGTCPA
jgi:hypothetical protein